MVVSEPLAIITLVFAVLADKAGFVNVFAGETEVGRPHLFRTGKAALSVRANLALFLRCVVFVGEPTLGEAI